ncbi:hypothetical protein EBU71_18125, partial [bacterium]|nr:hypothetical protein [Candidatus Elulimicrobium humile]
VVIGGIPMSGWTCDLYKIKFKNPYGDEPSEVMSVVEWYSLEREDPFKLSRQQIRVGRGVQGLLSSAKYQFSQSEIEQFVNLYKSEFDKSKDFFRNFEIVKGKDIEFYYDEENYSMNKGQLSNSCMRYSRCKSYFDIYVSNPEVCSLLILRDDENPKKIKGRALVWNLNDPSGIGPTDVIFMDRIYTHDDSDILLFRDYAKSKGWYSKKNNDNSVESFVVTPSNERKEFPNLVVKVKDKQYQEWPYMDTFAYYYPETNTLETIAKDLSRHILRSTSGGSQYHRPHQDCETCDSDGEVECEGCGGTGVGSDWVDCDECNGYAQVPCMSCNGAGEMYYGGYCGNCNGTGRSICFNCRHSPSPGRVRVDCEDCGGNGVVPCPDCT